MIIESIATRIEETENALYQFAFQMVASVLRLRLLKIPAITGGLAFLFTFHWQFVSTQSAHPEYGTDIFNTFINSIILIFTMNRIKPGLDIISDLLKETLLTYPTSTFVESLLFQYQERGSLSKKQLEGLYNKAATVNSIAPGKLATLEAIILKKPTRYKSPLPVPAPLISKDILLENMIAGILLKYPLHKRVLFIKLKFENNEVISALERAEIERFFKLFNK